MRLRFLTIALMLALAGSAQAAKDTCFDCHGVMEGMSHKFVNDIHFTNQISCAQCHGGDPNETDQNISMNASRGFKVRVTRQAIPEFCGGCHSNATFMAKFGQTRVDQLAQYRTSVHAKLLAAGRRRVAECVDCHSVHDIHAVSDPLSIASPQRISKTCAKCHAATYDAFANTPHGRQFKTQRLPGCTVCHSDHDIQPATTAMLTGPTSACARCHRDGSREAKVAEDMAQFLAKLEAAGPGSKDALARARVAVHTLDLEALKKAAETVPAKSDDN